MTKKNHKGGGRGGHHPGGRGDHHPGGRGDHHPGGRGGPARHGPHGHHGPRKPHPPFSCFALITCCFCCGLFAPQPLVGEEAGMDSASSGDALLAPKEVRVEELEEGTTETKKCRLTVPDNATAGQSLNIRLSADDENAYTLILPTGVVPGEVLMAIGPA